MNEKELTLPVLLKELHEFERNIISALEAVPIKADPPPSMLSRISSRVIGYFNGKEIDQKHYEGRSPRTPGQVKNIRK